MIIGPNMTRHARAMLDPQSDDEKLVVQAFQLLTRIADAHPNDYIAVAAMEGTGVAVLKLLEYLTSSSGIDQGILAQSVSDVVEGAGGNPDNL